MLYSKPPLSFEAQADLLLSRGMAGDRRLMIKRLSAVNYYRLSAYWHPFVNPDDTFAAQTEFTDVWDRYVFDRKLRLILMDAVERIEVCVRTQLAYHHSMAHTDPFAYAEQVTSLPILTPAEHTQFVTQVEQDYQKSREEFVEHFRIKYGGCNKHMPAWMAVELMTFGCMLTFYRGATATIRRDVAQVFGVHFRVLDSWLLTLNTIRNWCAHHGRCWNRVLGTPPKIPRDTIWDNIVSSDTRRIYTVLTICRHCLMRIAPQSHWHQRLFALLQQHSAIPLHNMGFPGDWQDSPFWQGVGEPS